MCLNEADTDLLSSSVRSCREDMEICLSTNRSNNSEEEKEGEEMKTQEAGTVDETTMGTASPAQHGVHHHDDPAGPSSSELPRGMDGWNKGKRGEIDKLYFIISLYVLYLFTF